MIGKIIDFIADVIFVASMILATTLAFLHDVYLSTKGKDRVSEMRRILKK